MRGGGSAGTESRYNVTFLKLFAPLKKTLKNIFILQRQLCWEESFLKSCCLNCFTFGRGAQKQQNEKQKKKKASKE